MKKFILFLAILFIIPINALALDYVATASDDRIFHTKADIARYGVRAYTDLNINISNIENLESFRMNVIYDNNVIGIQGCMYLYIVDIRCYGGGGTIYFDYSRRREDRLNKYNLFNITFMPKDTTPTSGTTEVRVEFENVKDKEQNDVYIEPLILEYKFEPVTFKWNGPNWTTDQENNEEKKDSNVGQENNTELDISNNQNSTNLSSNNNQQTVNINTNNIQNKNTSEEVKKSNNNNLKNLDVPGYEIKFSKDVYEYTIDIDNKTDKLDIAVELEDSKASILIEGNENLSNNELNLIKIKVIAEDLSEKEYLIKTNRKQEIIETNETIDTSKNSEEIKTQENNFSQIIIYAFVALVFLILTVVIIKFWLNKKK